LPYEHATGSRKIYTKAYWGSALNALHKENWKQAQTLLEQALEWPEKLGVGKPFDPEERWERFLLAFIYEKKGENQAFDAELKQIIAHSEQQLYNPSKKHLLGIYALLLTEGKNAAQEFIAQLLESKHGATKTTENLVQFYYDNSAFEWNSTFLNKLAAYMNN